MAIEKTKLLLGELKEYYGGLQGNFELDANWGDYGFPQLLVGDIIKFVLYLSSGDGVVESSKREYLSNLIDIDISEEQMALLVARYNFANSEARTFFVVQPLKSFLLCLWADKSVSGEEASSEYEKLIDLFRQIGVDVISVDGAVPAEAATDLKVFLGALTTTAKDAMANPAFNFVPTLDEAEKIEFLQGVAVPEVPVSEAGLLDVEIMETPVPEVSEDPLVPELSEVSDAVAVAAEMVMPEIPDIPDIPDVPDVPEVPVMTAAPEESLPTADSIPDLVMPEMAPLPSEDVPPEEIIMPEIPDIPAMDVPLPEAPLPEAAVTEESVPDVPVLEDSIAEEPVMEEVTDPIPVVEEVPIEVPVMEDAVTEAPVPEVLSMEEPAVEEPAMEEPAMEEPTMEEPVILEPIAEEPVSENASLTETPSIDIPVMAEPAIEAAMSEVPVMEEPAIEAAMSEVPVMEESVIEAALAEAPMMKEPLTEEPVAVEPPVEAEPIMEEPMPEIPGVDVPAVDEPVIEESLPEMPIMEEPLTDVSVNEEPVPEEPPVEAEPIMEEPLPDLPVMEEPVMADPVVDEGPVEEPMVDPLGMEDAATEQETVPEISFIEEPIVEEPAAEPSVSEEPVMESPIIEEVPDIASEFPAVPMGMSVEEVFASVSAIEVSAVDRRYLEISIGENGSSYIALCLTPDKVQSVFGVSVADAAAAMLIGNNISIAYDSSIITKNLLTGGIVSKASNSDIVKGINDSIAGSAGVNAESVKTSSITSEAIDAIFEMTEVSGYVDQINDMLNSINSRLQINRNESDTLFVADDRFAIHSIAEVLLQIDREG